MSDPTSYNAKVRSKYSLEEKAKKVTQVTADPQIEVDLWSINDLVEHSLSEKEAMDRFMGMHGFSMSRDDAHRALDRALKRKFAPIT